MEIKLESNRKFLFKYLISVIILLTTITIIIIGFAIVDKLTFDILCVIILSSILDIIHIFVIIFVLKKRKPQYVFNIDKIVYIKKNEKHQIKVPNIKSMTYVRMKWYNWFLALFVAVFGDTSGFAFPVIKVVELDGKEHELGFFSKKEIESLKNIYGSMLDV